MESYRAVNWHNDVSGWNSSVPKIILILNPEFWARTVIPVGLTIFGLGSTWFSATGCHLPVEAVLAQ